MLVIAVGDKEEEAKLETFEMYCYRKMFKIKSSGEKDKRKSTEKKTY